MKRHLEKKEKQKDENSRKPVGEISFVVALFFDLNERLNPEKKKEKTYRIKTNNQE